MVDNCGIDALVSQSRRVLNLKNRVDESTEQAIIQHVIDYLAHGQHKTTNELRVGIFVSDSGVRSICLRYNLENFNKRLMILKKLEDGYTYRQLAVEYQISTSTIQNWHKNIDGVECQCKPTKIDNNALIADVEKYPDDYQYERARRFNCSDRGISKALKRLGITQKKDLKPS